jgi:hypothetical protein
MFRSGLLRKYKSLAVQQLNNGCIFICKKRYIVAFIQIDPFKDKTLIGIIRNVQNYLKLML